MKRYLVWHSIVVGVVLAGVLAGCSTISSVGSLISDITGSDSEAESQQGGSDSGAVASSSGAAPSAAGPITASRMQAMQATMMFNSTYFQAFFIGAYNPSTDDFREGEGVTWEISNDDRRDVVVIERALLKRVGDSAWWYLSLSSGGDAIEYEVLIDSDFVPIEMVWRDPDSGEVLRQTFNEGQVAGPGAGAQSGAMVYSPEVEARVSKETERVRVAAGSYSAEHLVYRASDYQTGDQVEYHWWVVESVPGDLVKFEYVATDGSGQELLSGELVETRTGYRTRFGAY